MWFSSDTICSCCHFFTQLSPLGPSLRGMTFSAEMRPCWQLHTRTGKWTERTDKGNHVSEPACNSCFTHLQTEGMSKTDSSFRGTIYEPDPALMLSRLEGLVLLRELSLSPSPILIHFLMVWCEYRTNPTSCTDCKWNFSPSSETTTDFLFQ